MGPGLPVLAGVPGQLAAEPFRPSGQQDLAPSGAAGRVTANIAAVATLRTIERDGRAGSPQEQRVLARWSGWGAVPEVFDDSRPEYARARDRLARLLSPEEMAAAERNTLNAHYTDAGIVQAVWSGLHALGFTGGRVPEPGSGNFIGFAPPSAEVTGVELDPVTAAITARLYPHAQIRTESFAGTSEPDGSFDLVAGNVPFGKIVLHDRAHNPGGHSIHNHFIIKSLRLTRPGGLVAVLTSRYTMDSRNPGARREMAGLDGHQVAVNEYFLASPGRVLGQLGAVHGAYSAGDLVVTPAPGSDLAADLTASLDAIAKTAQARDLTWLPAQAPAATSIGTPLSGHPDGHITAASDGCFRKVIRGREEQITVPRSQAGELRNLLRLRDTAVRLLDAEAASALDTAEIGRLRTELNRHYDGYAAAFGPLNRFSLRRTGRTDPATGQDKMARVRPPQGGFRDDPFAPLVYALEVDPVGQRAAKAAIFTHRVIAPRTPRLGADTAADALAICLDTCGEPRLDQIARLLGTSPEDARAQLGTLVFDDPATGRLVTAAEYLSGNVRAKHRQAHAAAEDDPRFAVNAAELAKAIRPRYRRERLTPGSARPGSMCAMCASSWPKPSMTRASRSSIPAASCGRSAAPRTPSLRPRPGARSVLRSYDNAELSLPGLTVTFRPRPHQVAAIARMISEPAVGLFHEVGAGKTAEMIIGVTELRRLGLAGKPAVIVPNHMIDQFAREWLQLDPQAKVLVAHREDLQGERRRELIARCATSQWDGVIMSRSAFERIPLSPAEQAAYMYRYPSPMTLG